MDQEEISIFDFRGGTRHSNLQKTHLIENIADVLDISSYKQLPLNLSLQAINKDYFDNKVFWQDAIDDCQFESMRVQLKGFHLTEWIPLTPGRYFTSSAHRSRNIARRSYNFTTQEYDLDGKTAMFLGGIGSVRLTAKTIASDMIYFLGASSNGISHQGIPIVLHQPEYHQVIQVIKMHGGCLANLIGTLRILPTSPSLIIYDRQVPKHCLVIDTIEMLHPSESSQLSTTISATFELNARSLSKPWAINTIDKAWTFNTFRPGSRERSIDIAVDGIKDYINRYSHAINPVLLSDFDEQYQHFTNTIDFPITKVFQGNINADTIHLYGNYYEIKEAYMGNKFEENKPTYNYSIGDISNSTVSGITQGENNTVIANLNKSGNNELAQALKTLTNAILSSKDLPDNQKEDNVKIVNQIGGEAIKAQPNKTFIKILSDGLLTTLKSIPDIAAAIAKLTPLLTQLHL